MSVDFRDLSKLPDAEFQSQLQSMKDEESRRLNQVKDKCLAELKAVLQRYEKGDTPRVVLGKQQAGEVQRYLSQTVSHVNVHITGFRNNGEPEPEPPTELTQEKLD